TPISVWRSCSASWPWSPSACAQRGCSCLTCTRPSPSAPAHDGRDREHGRSMSAIRSILLHVDTSGGSAARLAFAHALADRHGAHLTVLFGVGPLATQTAFAYSAGAALMAAETRDRSVDAERERLR